MAMTTAPTLSATATPMATATAGTSSGTSIAASNSGSASYSDVKVNLNSFGHVHEGPSWIACRHQTILVAEYLRRRPKKKGSKETSTVGGMLPHIHWSSSSAAVGQGGRPTCLCQLGSSQRESFKGEGWWQYDKNFRKYAEVHPGI